MPNHSLIIDKEIEKTIINLYEAGKSLNWIHNKFGLCSDTVKRIILSNNLVIKPKLKLPHDKILEKYHNGMNKIEIANYFNVTEQAIYYVLVKYGIMKKNKRKKVLTPEEEKSFIDRFVNNHEPSSKLCEEYRISPSSGHRILRKNNIFPQKECRSYRKYTLNEHYFDNINSEEKAYFLGLMYADGFNGEDSGEMEISLKDKDLDILIKFNESIGSNKPIRFRNNKTRMGNVYRYARLWIHSRIMSKRLAQLGCVQRKSLILEFPKDNNIPKDLFRHFIRGYYDGNGYISKVSKIYGVELVSTIMFIEKFQNLLTKELGIEGCIVKHANGKTTRILKIGGTIQPLKFLDWLYKDATIYLDRKYKRYQALKDDRKKYAANLTNS